MSVGELAKGERQFAQTGGVEALAVPVRIRRRRRRADPRDARVGAPVDRPRGRAARRDRHGRVVLGARCAPSRPTCRCGSASSTSSTTAGTYTTNGPIKRANRRNEQALRAAELWSVAPRPARDWDGYPAATLDEAWKLLLLNQFHDIIPGSSIHWANDDCLRDHARIAELTADSSRPRSGRSSRRSTPSARPRPSSCSTPRRATAASSSESRPTTGPSSFPSRCPACGYATIDLEAARHAARAAAGVTVSDRSLENELLRVSWDDDGLLTSIFDKEHGREVLAPGRARQRVPAARGPPAGVRRVERRHRLPRPPHRPHRHLVDRRGRARPAARRGAVRPRASAISTITQTMRLASGSRRLEFETEVDWHEHHKFLKVAFPVNVHASPRDLRDPVRPPRAADAREHVVGCRALRGVRAPLGRPERARLRRRAAQRLQVRLRHPRQRHAAVAAARRRAGPIPRAIRARTASRTRCSRTPAICARPEWSPRPRRSTCRSSWCRRSSPRRTAGARPAGASIVLGRPAERDDRGGEEGRPRGRARRARERGVGHARPRAHLDERCRCGRRPASTCSSAIDRAAAVRRTARWSSTSARSSSSP